MEHGNEEGMEQFGTAEMETEQPGLEVEQQATQPSIEQYHNVQPNMNQLQGGQYPDVHSSMEQYPTEPPPRHSVQYNILPSVNVQQSVSQSHSVAQSLGQQQSIEQSPSVPVSMGLLERVQERKQYPDSETSMEHDGTSQQNSSPNTQSSVKHSDHSQKGLSYIDNTQCGMEQLNNLQRSMDELEKSQLSTAQSKTEEVGRKDGESSLKQTRQEQPKMDQLKMAVIGSVMNACHSLLTYTGQVSAIASLPFSVLVIKHELPVKVNAWVGAGQFWAIVNMHAHLMS